MTATTDLYLQLQRLYRSKADEHCSAVLWHARTLVSAVGREPGSVSGDEVRLFCRNVRNLRVVHFRDIAAQASEVNAAGLRPVRFQVSLLCSVAKRECSSMPALRHLMVTSYLVMVLAC